MPLSPCLVSFCGRPCAEGFRQVVPEPEQARVQHLQNSADIARTAFIQVKSSGGCVEIFGISSGILALEEFHRDKCIEEVGDAAGMETELFTQFRSGEAAIAERGEKTKGNSSEENFRIPEAEGSLQNWVGRRRRGIHDFRFSIEPGVCYSTVRSTSGQRRAGNQTFARRNPSAGGSEARGSKISKAPSAKLQRNSKV
jgi:hypothetical protein